MKKVSVGLVLAMSLMVILFATGCGGSGTGSSSSDSSTASNGGEASGSEGDSGSAMAEAEKELAAAEGIPDFTLDAPPVDASKAKGKKLFVIPIASSDQFTASIEEEVSKIAQELGIHTTLFENQGSPTEWTQGINQAVSEKVDAIAMIGGPDPSAVLPQLEQAKNAGIPAVVVNYYEYSEVPPAVEKVMGAFVQGPFAEAGKLMADYAYVQTDGKPHPLIITAEETAPAANMVKAIQDQLAHLCPDCESDITNVPVADWASKMQGAVQSALVSNPDVNYVLPLFDSMSIGAQTGVSGAGKTGQVGLASYNGTPAVLKLIEEGDIVQMDAGENTNWIAYATMDQALRMMTGSPVVPNAVNNEKLPLRVFTDDNIAEAGSPPVAGKGYGDAYVDGYEKLWGLAK